ADVGFRRVGPHHACADARKRLRQDSGSAADIEDAQVAQAIERARIAAKMPARGLADEGDAHRVDHVQCAHLAARIPPGLPHCVEMGDLGGIDGRLGVERFAFHAFSVDQGGAVAASEPRRYVYAPFCKRALLCAGLSGLCAPKLVSDSAWLAW